MEKEQLLSLLKSKLESGEIRQDEITNIFGISNANSQSVTKGMLTVNKILYSIGTLIVVIGIIFFMMLIWEDIGSFGRIISTLGLGIVFASIGSVLFVKKPGEQIGAVFHTISGVLVPIGALVTLFETTSAIPSLWQGAVTFAILFVVYLILDYIHKHPILSFFSIVHGTVFVFALLGAFINDMNGTEGLFGLNGTESLFGYLTVLVGISYLMLGRTFALGRNKRLSGLLYFFGSIGILSGVLIAEILKTGLGEALYFIVIFICFAISTKIKSISALVATSLFFIGYSSYITFKYFADSIAWPFLVIILGFIFIGLGYISVSVGKKYLSN